MGDTDKPAKRRGRPPGSKNAKNAEPGPAPKPKAEPKPSPPTEETATETLTCPMCGEPVTVACKAAFVGIPLGKDGPIYALADPTKASYKSVRGDACGYCGHLPILMTGEKGQWRVLPLPKGVKKVR